jgi:RNA polymerase-binding protein DksA
LIWVKRPGGPKIKLKSDHFPNTPIVPKSQFSEFSALLQAQRKPLLDEVREKIAASGEGLGFVNQSKITDDDGLADAAAEMEVAMVMRESQELQEIEAALARIGDGSYGSCSDCGEEIGLARLKASPAARRCLPCQEKYERAQGQVFKPGL